MDVREASDKGLPWCVGCERTDGEFTVVADPQRGLRMLCTDCASPIQEEAQVKDNLPNEQVESEANRPTTAEEKPPGGMTEAAKAQEEATREAEADKEN